MSDAYPAHITMISELLINPVSKRTGFPHAAILLEYAPPRKEGLVWYGFGPGPNGGFVDDSDRTSWIDRYIRFPTRNGYLDLARKMMHTKYGPHGEMRPPGFRGATYAFPFRDCISMALDALQECMIPVSLARGIPFPDMAVGHLRNLELHTHFDEKPYPWKV